MQTINNRNVLNATEKAIVEIKSAISKYLYTNSIEIKHAVITIMDYLEKNKSYTSNFVSSTQIDLINRSLNEMLGFSEIKEVGVAYKLSWQK